MGALGDVLGSIATLELVISLLGGGQTKSPLYCITLLSKTFLA